MILNISAPGFWEQPQLTLTLILGFYLVCVAVIVFLVHRAKNSLTILGNKIGQFWQTPTANAIIRVIRVLLSMVGIFVLVASIKGSGDAGMGLLALMILWPCVVGQIIVGFLPWERFIQKGDMGALFIVVLFLAGILDYTVYSF